jgi:hypothetical protein
MSHFSVAVFHREDQDIEDLLAPYNEEIVVAPYVKYTREQAIAKTRKDIEEYKNGLYAEYLANPEEYAKNCSNEAHLEYLREVFPKKLNWTDEECYEDVARYYDEDDKDEEGNLYSTYNPNSKWDWYSIGGRWRNFLTTKSGEKVDEDYVSELDFPDDFSTFAVVLPNGRWYEAGSMGWWAIVTNRKDDWEATYKEKFLDKANPDWILTIVDCHI